MAYLAVGGTLILLGRIWRSTIVGILAGVIWITSWSGVYPMEFPSVVPWNDGFHITQVAIHLGTVLRLFFTWSPFLLLVAMRFHKRRPRGFSEDRGIFLWMIVGLFSFLFLDARSVIIPLCLLTAEALAKALQSSRMEGLFALSYSLVIWGDIGFLSYLKCMGQATTLSFVSVLVGFQVFVVVGALGMRRVREAILGLAATQAMLLTAWMSLA